MATPTPEANFEAAPPGTDRTGIFFRDQLWLKSKMTGIEYMLSEVMEPHLFVIRKQKRDRPEKVTPMLVITYWMVQYTKHHRFAISLQGRALYYMQKAFTTAASRLEKIGYVDTENKGATLESKVTKETIDFKEVKRVDHILAFLQRKKNEHLETLQIRGCHSLTFIFRGQLPPSLKKLSIKDCEKLQCLLDDNESSTYSSSSINVNSHSSHLVELMLNKCPSLTCLPLPDQFSATLTSLNISYCSNLTTLRLPAALKHLHINDCPQFTTLLPRDRLPKTLEKLDIWECGKLESIVERFHNNMALYKISISLCSNLKSIPDGLYTLRSLREISIASCQDLVSFPKGGLPNSILEVSIYDCEKLTALPSRIHTLTSLQHLYISQCPCLSYREEGLPANLSFLNISNLYKPPMNLGFHNLTSLKILGIHELVDAESFHEEEMEMTLPHTLTWLLIENFPKLKCLSCKSLENLTSLEHLGFINCREFTSLPNLPSSLLDLYIKDCPLLKEACKRDKGKEWYKIADIPRVKIDEKFIYDP
ncbi:hypothetical protein EZV62_003692 [Acer yangbiense]|uniref:Disease resistance protein At4g27190-like leucine-rich repeats domain-containing protein n=1 Tax=Acer yangbiense TaxID=1000413 RepID=A0A5C7IHF5_9ROSI|nr:hypothetical protein EZV62_003692 [Acer yangbiense]